jgi:hypothetical protein
MTAEAWIIWLGKTMTAEAWVALLAIIVSAAFSFITLKLSRLQVEQHRREVDQARREVDQARQEAVIKALQGEKEAVAYVALQIRRDQWLTKKENAPFRNDIIASLCLAWILEGSDRAKSLVLAALKEAFSQYPTVVKDIVADIEEQFTAYDSVVRDDKDRPKLTKGREYLRDLRKAIHNWEAKDSASLHVR